MRRPAGRLAAAARILPRAPAALRSSPGARTARSPSTRAATSGRPRSTCAAVPGGQRRLLPGRDGGRARPGRLLRGRPAAGDGAGGGQRGDAGAGRLERARAEELAGRASPVSRDALAGRRVEEVQVGGVDRQGETVAGAGTSRGPRRAITLPPAGQAAVDDRSLPSGSTRSATSSSECGAPSPAGYSASGLSPAVTLRAAAAPRPRPARQVHRRAADEAGHEEVRRARRRLVGRADLLQPAVVSSPRSGRPASSPRSGRG